jgi:hypothetical protein
MTQPLLQEFDLSTRSMVLWPLTRFNIRDLLRYSGLRRFQFSTFTLSQNSFIQSPQIPATCPPQINGPRSLRGLQPSRTSGLYPSRLRLIQPFTTSSFSTLNLLLTLRLWLFGPSQLWSFNRLRDFGPSTLQPFATSAF